MTSYLYYPGCSMEGSGRAYRESLEGICEPLGITFEEIDDWNCCGATEYVSLSTTPGLRDDRPQPGHRRRREEGHRARSSPPAAPATSTWPRRTTTWAEQPALNARINDALGAGGLHYDPGTIKVRHLLEVILNDVGLDKVKAAVTKPLTGLKVAPYLGCMVPRPD